MTGKLLGQIANTCAALRSLRFEDFSHFGFDLPATLALFTGLFEVVFKDCEAIDRIRFRSTLSIREERASVGEMLRLP